MPRAREIGIRIGVLPTGPTNSVLDVAGVGLGHTTLVRDEPAPPEGRGTARTGVTTLLLAEDAYTRPLAAGGAVLNGAGECTGLPHRHGVGDDRDAGLPDLDHAAGPGVRRRLPDRPRAGPRRGRGGGDPGGRRVRRLLPQRLPGDAGRDGRRAGVVPAGSRLPRKLRRPRPKGRSAPAPGCPASGFKGGIGTASRVTPAGHTVAVLLLTNFGERKRLTVAGVPVGSAGAASDDGAGRAGGLVHRRRRHRRAGQRQRLRPARPADRARARAHRVDGAPRQRRDLPRRVDHVPGRPRRPARRRDLASPVAGSTTSSRRSSTPPRSRCSTPCSASPTTVGRDGNTSRGARPRPA